MLTHSLLTLYRSLTRHRLYAALNVLGLAVGVAVFLVLFLDVRFETSFDRWLPNVDNLYRLTSIYTFPGRAPDVQAQTSGAVAPAFRTDYPQSETVRLFDSPRPVSNGSILETEQTDYVDPNFFDVLDLPVVFGSKAGALAEPDNVMVTEAIAEKYFGSLNVIGRNLTLYYHGVPHSHRISAVLRDLPVNTHLRFGIIAPFTPAMEADPQNATAYWGEITGYTYVRFHHANDARAVAQDLTNFAERRAQGPHGDDQRHVLRLRLTPVTALHFADVSAQGPMKPGVDARLVYALAIVGVLTLLVAMGNYVNLATARSSLRAREIALRKVMGATRQDVASQLLLESTAFAVAATLLGLALAELWLPLFNAIGGTTLSLSYWGEDSILPWLLLGALAIGVVSGLYPALTLSRFQPALVLASSRTPGGGRLETRVRSVLIGGQFLVAVLFTICTIVVGSQAQFIRTQNRGFQRDGLIILDNVGAVLLADRQNQVLDELRRVPGVVSVTASYRVPGLPDENVTSVYRPGAQSSVVSMDIDVIADDYLKTYGMTLAAGRMFDRAHAMDDIDGPFKGPGEASRRGIDVMLNESAAIALGFKTPAQAVGQLVVVGDGTGKDAAKAVKIIGVLKDVRFGSALIPAGAVIYRYDSQSIGGASGAVRYTGVSDAVMMARLRAAWVKVAPNVPFLGETAEGALRGFYLPDQQRARLFLTGSILAVVLSCIGLYGLASFSTARRVKEVGIRKALGASAGDILRLLIGQFLRPVLIANLVAWPLAYWAVENWLSSFNQRIDLNPLYFIDATALTLAVAVATVAGQAYAVARAEPSKALRHE